VEAAAAEAAVEAAKLANGTRRSAGGPQSGVFLDGDEWDRTRQNGIRRFKQRSMVFGGEWFREDVTTSLPYLEITVYLPRCRGLYMEQDQLLLHVDALNVVSGMPLLMMLTLTAIVIYLPVYRATEWIQSTCRGICDVSYVMCLSSNNL